MNPFIAWVLARLSEPSTYNGLAAIIASMAFLPHATDLASALPSIGVGLGGLIGVIKAEAGK